MTAPTIDAIVWRGALPHQPGNSFDRMLIVQCSLDWLRPTYLALREEIDEIVIKWCTRRTDLRIDRLVLHNPPIVQGIRDGDLADLNAAHTEWLERLANASVLLQHPGLHIHRLIVGGNQAQMDVEDFVDLHWDGSWLRPQQTGRVMELLSGASGTTPLTGYDVDLDGPFGDADPSVYI